MTVEQQFSQDIDYNRLNPVFPDEYDDIFGEHQEGYYQVYTEDEEQRDVQRIIFDNGNTYDIILDKDELIFKGQMPNYLFVHRYIQILIRKFCLEKLLPPFVAGDVICSTNEVISRPFVRIIISRENGYVAITNFHLDMKYQHRNIGKDFLKLLFALCQQLQFRLLLLDCMPTFYDRMIARGAAVIQANDHLEITLDTDLENHYSRP